MSRLGLALSVAVLACASCALNSPTSQEYLSITQTSDKGIPNGTSLASEYLDWLEPTDDPLYGFIPEKPILIGGYLEGRGGTWTAQYFSSILGPNGEQSKFERVGTCCAFRLEDKRLLDAGRSAGLLDVYELVIPSTGMSKKVYVSIYEEGDIYILNGYTGRSK
ncbi:hypothetical protein KO528_14900 [Saccharophagus degradans]|uniref:2-dehydro-3-deoxyphosphooctonate aldolase n=1 Tax=Saccharophagus degradans TaxID=86304 RepID=A0AAW7XB23_9GAMM|nr:hypothetical protein [Saccharophagus degradans]MBU2986650.1 hypothetical protein [Saccharophagus degradans]MDO6424739.1 hypothetical protein [Saccharophagus degradans]MDO6609509.1 hypothetical protein [Saccharophagus degradans]